MNGCRCCSDELNEANDRIAELAQELVALREQMSRKERDDLAGLAAREQGVKAAEWYLSGRRKLILMKVPLSEVGK